MKSTIQIFGLVLFCLCDCLLKQSPMNHLIAKEPDPEPSEQFYQIML